MIVRPSKSGFRAGADSTNKATLLPVTAAEEAAEAAAVAGKAEEGAVNTAAAEEDRAAGAAAKEEVAAGKAAGKAAAKAADEAEGRKGATIVSEEIPVKTVAKRVRICPAWLIAFEKSKKNRAARRKTHTIRSRRL